jgi:hypothetical protein
MILTSVEVEDFDRFWATFSTRGLEKRREHGSRGARVLRRSDDPNRVHVLFDWDRDGFEAFLADPEAAGIMEAAGLKRPPEPAFVDAQEQLEA